MSEVRLIDANILKAKIKSKYDNDDAEFDRGYIIGLEAAVDLIDSAPTIDITEEQAIDKLHETGWMQMHDKEMTKRPRKSNRKPKCTNFSNCGDCVHAEFVWDGVTFRGIRCLKGCK